jgi:hypothetical protein
MKTNFGRRRFLAWVTTVGGLSALGMSIRLEAAEKEKRTAKKGNKKRKRRAVSVLDLRHRHFQELVGQEFEVSSLRRDIKLELVEVRQHEVHKQSRRPIYIRQQPFSLLFIAPGREKLKSCIYELEHPELGEFDLFLHEVGADRDAKTVHYEVVFN